METINKNSAGVPEYLVRHIAASNRELWVNWQHTATGSQEIWNHDADANRSMHRVFTGKIADMSAEYNSDAGELLYVLMADGKRVKRIDKAGTVTSVSATLPSDATKFVQIINVTHKGGEESNVD